MEFQVVKDLIQSLAESIGVTIIRAEQGGKQPDSPYGSYKAITKNNGNYGYQNEIEIEDPTKYKEEFSRKEEFSVSLSFISIVSSDDLWSLADQAFDYLNVLSRERKQELEIAVEMLNTVSDRTVYLDPIYEYKVGFDIRVKGLGRLERTIDAVDIEGSVSGVGVNVE